jgi:ABC-type glycerol-3-phosphate transport system substrate-binding protein
MKKILAAGAAALMTATVLAGCGGDSGDSGGSGGGYCDDLKGTKTTVTALGDADMTQATFDKLSGDVQTIADEAPSDVKGDWNTIADALQKFNTAMSDAGITFDNLKDLGKAGGPTLDPAKLQAITAAAGALDADAITTASDNINKEVKSECNIDLDIGG